MCFSVVGFTTTDTRTNPQSGLRVVESHPFPKTGKGWGTRLSFSQPGAKLDDIAQAATNQPITPESSGNWTMFLFLVLLMTVGAIVDFLLHR